MAGGKCRSSLLALFTLALMIPDLIHCLSYPVFTSKRFAKSGPAYFENYRPATIPESRLTTNFDVPDYDENYIPYSQVEEEEYPLSSVYDYRNNQPSTNSFIDYEDDGIIKGNNYPYEGNNYPYEGNNYPYEGNNYPYEGNNYPYEREFFDDEDDRQARVALLRNLMLSGMEQEQETNEIEPEYVYGKPVVYSPYYDEEIKNRKYYYGRPVYGDKSKTRGRKEDSMRDLMLLAKQMKAAERAKKSEKEGWAPFFGGNEESFRGSHFQKKMSRDGRKQNFLRREGFKMNEKRFYSPEKIEDNAGDGQNQVGKELGRKNKTEATVLQTKPPQAGQKEYVLPRPAGPVRKPFQRGIYNRSTDKSNVYRTIKKLLAEEEVHKDTRPRIQKRFVLSEDQLTSQLSGLKRIAV